MTQPDWLAATAQGRKVEAMKLRHLLETYTEDELRHYCGDWAKRYTEALFRYGVIDSEGAVSGKLPNFNPDPNVFQEVLHGEFTGEHVNGVASYYHEAERGDVREMLATLADWSDKAADALVAGERLPACLVCEIDHTPRPAA